MKKFEDLDLSQVDWSKYEKQLNRISSRLDKIKKSKKMMQRIESLYNSVNYKSPVIWHEIKYTKYTKKENNIIKLTKENKSKNSILSNFYKEDKWISAQ